MVAYRFEIDEPDGKAGRAESGTIAQSRDGPDGWVVGDTIAGNHPIGGCRGRTPREARRNALLTTRLNPTPSELAAGLDDAVLAQTELIESDHRVDPDPACLLGAFPSRGPVVLDGFVQRRTDS
jgi:hypothetical protein